MVKGTGLTNMAEIELKDFEQQYIFLQYEFGTPVSEIAKAMGKTETFVYAQLRTKPEKYEDIKRIREEQHNLTLRRVRGLADQITQDYLEHLQKKLTEASDQEKEGLYKQIEQVVKIAKQYADRVNLAEGKATENIGIGNAGQLPFKMIVTKTYATKEEADNAPDD
jgi:HD-GYP domain-containing protein (c-di-GMP phosphodiesterase class II)